MHEHGASPPRKVILTYCRFEVYPEVQQNLFAQNVEPNIERYDGSDRKALRLSCSEAHNKPKNPLRPMIVSRFIRSLNFVLDRESVDTCIFSFHLIRSSFLLGAIVS